MSLRRRLVACLLIALPACQGAPPEQSVKPGINADFLDPQLDVAKYEQRFEVESREVFAHRAQIAGLVPLGEGTAVADVGAGTGLFTWMFAGKVGDRGRVYAVDIAERFVEHIGAGAGQRGLGNVIAVRCTERSAELPEASVDVVFVCDTYHHFEYPQSTLASLHRALRPGGQLVIVDFVREPGVSRPWILDHVRAGMDQVQAEVEAAGFRLAAREPTPFLKENYCLRFVKA
ncbi:MAG: class I SAM-dependent methyltransferase [Planctomycetes bacterium]|nr:class I SAM-dependent methyltransferase [Planctomycetota bacterium]